MYNGTHKSFADLCSFILDTTTIATYMPHMEHGDFGRFGKFFWNQHKHMFGVKLELAVATQRVPVPIAASVVPAGFHDLRIARLPGGVFAHMCPGERALGDPGYVGDHHIYAPPRRNMLSYVAEFDKSELTLQRRVEMANRHLKEFKCVGTVYRKGSLRALGDLQIIGIVVTKLVYLDLMLNQEYSGHVHVTGPIPDKVSRNGGRRVLHNHDMLRNIVRFK
jgi:hypothetical protein